MKIKFRDQIIDGSEEPVMVILTDADKRNIAMMHPECTRYAQAPDQMDSEELRKFMDVPKDVIEDIEAMNHKDAKVPRTPERDTEGNES